MTLTKEQFDSLIPFNGTETGVEFYSYPLTLSLGEKWTFAGQCRPIGYKTDKIITHTTNWGYTTRQFEYKHVSMEQILEYLSDNPRYVQLSYKKAGSKGLNSKNFVSLSNLVNVGDLIASVYRLHTDLDSEVCTIKSFLSNNRSRIRHTNLHGQLEGVFFDIIRIYQTIYTSFVSGKCLLKWYKSKASHAVHPSYYGNECVSNIYSYILESKTILPALYLSALKYIITNIDQFIDDSGLIRVDDYMAVSINESLSTTYITDGTLAKDIAAPLITCYNIIKILGDIYYSYFITGSSIETKINALNISHINKVEDTDIYKFIVNEIYDSRFLAKCTTEPKYLKDSLTSLVNYDHRGTTGLKKADDTVRITFNVLLKSLFVNSRYQMPTSFLLRMNQNIGSYYCDDNQGNIRYDYALHKEIGFNNFIKLIKIDKNFINNYILLFIITFTGSYYSSYLGCSIYRNLVYATVKNYPKGTNRDKIISSRVWAKEVTL